MGCIFSYKSFNCGFCFIQIFSSAIRGEYGYSVYFKMNLLYVSKSVSWFNWLELSASV